MYPVVWSLWKTCLLRREGKSALAAKLGKAWVLGKPNTEDARLGEIE